MDNNNDFGGMGWLLLLFLFSGNGALKENTLDNTELYNNQKLDTITSTNSQRFFDLQSQLAQCCCDNKLAIADLKFQNCQNTNEIIQNSNANTQSIKDVFVGQEIDRLREQLSQSNIEKAISNQTQTILNAQGTYMQTCIPCPSPCAFTGNGNRNN
jgi:hypothetical protein